MTARREFCEYRTTYDLLGGRDRFGSWCQYYADYHSRVATGTVPPAPTLHGEGRWYELGRPSYIVHTEMAGALEHTRLDVPAEQFRLPYETLVIRFAPRAVFVAPSLVTDNTRGRLRGAPFVRAMMVAECPASLADLEFRAAHETHGDWSNLASVLSAPATKGRRMVGITLDVSDDDPNSRHEGQIFVGLSSGTTLGQCVASRLRLPSWGDSSASDEDCRRISAIAAGVVFLAISKDRKYVERTRIKPRPTDECVCGSGQKHKLCCGKKGPREGEPVGFEVGRAIDLPYRSSTSRSVTTGDGRELEFGHVRTGHMRWQKKKDDAGAWTTELTFVHPTIVRPDLPLKPLLTPRQVRERAGRMDTPSTGETS